MGEITDLLSGGQSGGNDILARAAQQAQDAINKSYNEAQGKLQPWETAGTGQIKPYQDFVDKLPNQMNGNWMKDYKESPYAKYLTNKSLTSMNNAAAATGVLGSGANQQENAETAEQIAGADAQNYFNNMQDQNRLYLNSQNETLNRGSNASTQAANTASQYGANQAALIANKGSAQASSHTAGQGGKAGALGLLTSKILPTLML